MEQLESAQTELTEARSVLDQLDARAAELTEARDRRVVTLREQGAGLTRERAQAVVGLPPELLGLYEKLRAAKGGVGVALLRARRCGGCSLDLNSGDLATIAKQPVDEVVRCEECGRILVRTGESGI